MPRFVLALIAALALAPLASAAHGEHAVDIVHTILCPNAASNATAPCAAMEGDPGVGGVRPCREPPASNLLAALVWEAARAVGTVADAVTSTPPLAGTPVEGEGLCHDHWETLHESVAFVD